MNKRRRRALRLALVAVALLSCVLAGSAATAKPGVDKTDPAAVASRHPIPAYSGWTSYLLDDPSPAIYPKSVEVLDNAPPPVPPGTLDNPNGFLAQDGSAATIHSTIAGSPAIVLDLGRNTGGSVQVGITASDGATVRLAYSEARRFLGPDGDVNHGSQGRNDDPSSRVDLIQGGAGDYTLAGVRGAERYIWLQLEGPGTVSIDYVRVAPNFLRPNPSDYTGRFLSSDEQLNRIWYAGAYTLNLATYGDPARGNKFAVTDGAKHDRLVWLGDLAMEQLVGAYTVRQMPPIIKRSVQMFTCQQYPDGSIQMASDTNVNCPHPGPPDGVPVAARKAALARGSCTCIFQVRLPEYTAWFVISATDHYQLTADGKVRQWLPVLRRAVKFFERRLDPGGLFVTDATGEINWHPPDIAAGADAHTNAVWVHALGDLSRLELEIGSPVQAKKDAKLAARTAAALRRRLYDPAVGAMRQNEANPSGDHTQDANAEAVLAGVLKGPSAASALRFIYQHLLGTFGPATAETDTDSYMSRYISPWITGWELIARFENGDTGTALDEIRREWGRMLAVDPGMTLWEKMTVDGRVPAYQGPNPDGSPISEKADVVPGSGETSLAHAWSAGPTYALSAFVLGLRPVDPGFATWIVQPQPGDLSFAQGQVMTRRGPLASRWQLSDRRSFKLTVRVPRGTTGTVGVPMLGSAKRTVGRDGVVVWKGGKPQPGVAAKIVGDYLMIAEDHRGTHTYAWGD